jgi:hypothetical protein
MTQPFTHPFGRPHALRLAAVAALLLGLGACTQDSPAGETALVSLEIAAPTPHELIYSGVQGRQSPPQQITLKNVGTEPLDLHALALSGEGAAAFSLTAPTTPLVLNVGDSVAAGVTFVPEQAGLQHASLVVHSSDSHDPQVEVALYGLGAEGEQGALEPPLQSVVNALGYALDVGGDELKLGTGSDAIGDEVLVPLFERAGPGPVSLTVVARYGPEETFPYGFFSLDGASAQRREVGRIAAEHAQELLPPLSSGSTSFDPGTQPFGIYGQAGGRTQYTLDALNQGEVAHATRVYPLRDRAGVAVPDSYLIGLEEAENGDFQDVVFVLENVRPSGAKIPDVHALAGWEPLFNGHNLDGWYTYLPSEGKNRDPEGVFKVTDGTLHILDVADRGHRDFGYLATEKSYRDYHLRLEYRWGDKRFAPRANAKRDSGVIYHFDGSDKVWPRGVEYQIQEGDTGDFWLIGGTTLSTTVASVRSDEPRYQQFGTPYTSRRGNFVRIVKDGTHESRHGWNTVDIIVRDDTAVHMINGRVNNRAYSLHRPSGGALTSGKILLQAEGAEIFYRNIVIRPLDDE